MNNDDEQEFLAILEAAEIPRDELGILIELGEDGRIVGLDLSMCEDLMTLPPEIGKLSHLETLDLSNCTSLTTLPLEIGNLSNIRTLDLSICTSLTTLPPEIGHLQELTELNISYCTSLTTLPDEIGNLSNITTLDLYNCTSLTTLPPEIGHLQKLTELNISHCTRLTTLPDEIGKLWRLEKLFLFRRVNLIPHKSIYGHMGPDVCSFVNAFLLLRDVNSEATAKIAVAEIMKEKAVLPLAVQHAEFASGIGMVLRYEPSLSSLEDRDGRTVWDLACRECKREFFFYKRYKLDGGLRYESNTCKVIFATDEVATDKDTTKKAVALKFFYKKEHFDAEKNAREDDKGKSRFDHQYVIAHLGFHDGDEDQEFARAAKEIHLPQFCLVLEQGDRNLYEAVKAENPDRNTVRSILSQLAKSLNYLHQQGFVHGDFKPVNAVREVGSSRQWKLIDFDAAVRVGEPMGLKFSTAYVPPEIIGIRNGIPEPLASGNEKIEKAEVLEAAASFDVWSFGIVMFSLVTGNLPSSFGEPNNQDNIRDLWPLVEWTDERRDRELSSVPDPLAKELLSTLLDPDPTKRPPMAKVCDDYFFSYDDYVAELRKRLQKVKEEGDKDGEAEVTQQLIAELKKESQKAEKDGDMDCKEAIREEIKSLREELKATVKEEGARTREELKTKATREDVKEEGARTREDLNRMRNTLMEKADEIASALSKFQRVTQAMLKSILINEFAPKYVFMCPASKEQGRLENLRDRCNPKNWVNKEVKVYFVCPVTLVCAGEGYELRIPKDWVKTYGPALRISLTVLQVACGVGRLAGLPISNISDIAGAATERLSGDAEYLSNMYEAITSEMNAAGLNHVTEWIDKRIYQCNSIEVAEDIVETLPPEEEQVKFSYQQVKQIGELVGDPDFRNLGKCGLVKAIGSDGSTEYVAEKVKGLYESIVTVVYE